ncbi:ribosomal protein S6 [Fomitopsis serialis]|uniref:ribosomal protein S6 n=1 Tax=Fomitopsis serialis TaxID=139415 RepID=UPI0020075F74|nr:ribosomal protein S6 [Neoantrodia serialis]KAH9915675.1 ribosomal protein S6 [Neoantrodia serialis]
MPFYQMLCITAHYNEYRPIKELVQRTVQQVWDRGGVVRRLNSWGTKTLPQRMRRHKQYHQIGDYWTMDFDASPRTLRTLNNLMRADPSVVRWTVLKLGDKVENIVTPPSKTTPR